MLGSLHPQLIFLPDLGVNQRDCLCEVAATPPRKRLIFFTLNKNPHFWIGNIILCPTLFYQSMGGQSVTAESAILNPLY